MVQLQGFGALLFGALTLAFIGALAVYFGGPVEITLALAAMFAAYGSQWMLFNDAYLRESGEAPSWLAAWGMLLMLTSITAGALSFIFSVWF